VYLNESRVLSRVHRRVEQDVHLLERLIRLDLAFGTVGKNYTFEGLGGHADGC
jgi:hypothetical protein